MRVTYQFQHSYSVDLYIDEVADDLTGASTDAEIDEAIMEELMDAMREEMPTPHLHGIDKVRAAVREYMAEQDEE